jgi:hypothetical protein
VIACFGTEKVASPVLAVVVLNHLSPLLCNGAESKKDALLRIVNFVALHQPSFLRAPHPTRKVKKSLKKVFYYLDAVRLCLEWAKDTTTARCYKDSQHVIHLFLRTAFPRWLRNAPSIPCRCAPSFCQNETLAACAALGAVNAVAALLKRGVTPNDCIHPNDGWGGSAFTWAVYGGHASVAELLLDRGASIDFDLLANYAGPRHHQVVKLFSQRKLIHPRRVDSSGRTLAELARSIGDTKSEKILIELDSNPFQWGPFLFQYPPNAGRTADQSCDAADMDQTHIENQIRSLCDPQDGDFAVAMDFVDLLERRRSLWSMVRTRIRFAPSIKLSRLRQSTMLVSLAPGRLPKCCWTEEQMSTCLTIVACPR